MPVVDRGRVGTAFDLAATYSCHAGVQRRVAAALATEIRRLQLPPRPTILEIGCGTGFLTRQLLDRGVEGNWLITDKAPGMVARCRAAIAEHAGRRFAVLDGEYDMTTHVGRYDLICASMTVQWFDDLQEAVGGLLEKLNPGGHLVFNTLAAETFHEWREALRARGLADGTVPFPSVQALRQMLGRFGPVAFHDKREIEAHRDAWDFLAKLKQIGAATPRRGHRPLPPRAMRQAMKAFDAAGARVTYEIVTCHFQRSLAA